MKEKEKSGVLVLLSLLATIGFFVIDIQLASPVDRTTRARDPGVRAGTGAAGGPIAGLSAKEHAFFELGLSKWDIAAGALIIREAGGRISDFHGGDGYLDSGNVVAGNPKTYAALSKLLAPFSAGVA